MLRDGRAAATGSPALRAAPSPQKHIKEHHEEVRERPCPHPGCNKVFMIDRYLQRHVKLIHTGVCPVPLLGATPRVLADQLSWSECGISQIQGLCVCCGGFLKSYLHDMLWRL